jgi:hypothetical protein
MNSMLPYKSEDKGPQTFRTKINVGLGMDLIVDTSSAKMEEATRNLPLPNSPSNS